MNTLGRYQLLKKIAGGGMAEIYLAKLAGPAGFVKEVVVKTILPHWSRHRDFIDMLVDEAKIAVQLNHPNTVSVYELAKEGETYFIAMEYVPGWDARRLLQAAAVRKASIPLDAALHVAIETLEGLAYAHDKKDGQGRPLGIVHRDISPQNLLLSREGDVKIADFGIAKAASKSHETATGVLKGKFAYMSPEQASLGALGEPDGRSDLFSMAVVLFELVTGERLFYRGSDAATLDAVRNAEFSPSAAAVRIAPKPLFEILRKALSRLPEDRYRNAREFRKALLDFASASGLEVRREKLARVLETFFSDLSALGSPEEPTVIDSSPTQTAAFPEDQSQTLVERTERDESVPIPSLRTGRPAAAAIVGFIVLYTLTAGVVWWRSGKPPFPPPEPETRPRATSSAPAMAPAALSVPEPLPDVPESHWPASPQAEVEPPVVALKPTQKSAPAAKGYLSVQALPWGMVTIDGAGKRDTPIRRLPLAAGKHTVRVRYEPDGRAVQATINIAAGKEIVCVANFRSGKELKCGN